jgi:hypothetical protein
MSAQVYNIFPGDVAWLGLNPNGDGQSCVGFVSGEDLTCLQTGVREVLGAFWFDGSANYKKPNSLSTTPPPCKFRQVADIYWLALPGEQRKPYSMNVTKEFEKLNAVDMYTHSFAPDQLDVIQDVLSQYGNGLTETQLAALSVEL